MKKVISILAYTWAFSATFLMLYIFMGSNALATSLINLTSMKIDPIYTGGDVKETLREDGLNYQIHKPVFSALFGESKEGYVQVKITSDTKLPESIVKEIDYNGDGLNDFSLNIHTPTSETRFESLQPDNPMHLNVSARVKDYWMVRVALKNPKKK